MPEVQVEYRRGERGEPEEMAFAINGTTPGFVIRTQTIADWSVGQVDNRLLDLLDIAATVLASDGLVTRGGTSRPRMGDKWRREFEFTIPVRDYMFWRRQEIRDLLGRTISFLTDDRVSFTFTQAEAFTPKQDYLRFFGANSNVFSGGHVVLFSGGLDSLAGALETLETRDGRVILVTHRSAPKIMPHQDRLAAKLARRYPGRVAYVPIRASFKGDKASERTQRSRSFLFAAFGFVMARIAGLDRLNFFENGVVSQNLPLSPMIVGTMATRTTHALALHKFGELLSLVAGSPFKVLNEFQWLTKKEVVEKIRAHGAEDLISDTVSCNHVVDRTVEFTHCGYCTQCLDRRFGVLAAGMEAADPDEQYETSVLLGSREDRVSIVPALEWTQHSVRLATINDGEFLESFGVELARLKRGYPDLEAEEVVRRSLRLHERHGKAVTAVLNDWAVKKVAELSGGSLPPTCLLRSFMADATAAPRLAEIVGRGAAARLPTSEPSDREATGGPLAVELVKDGARHEVRVRDLGSVFNEPAKPAFALHRQYEEDRSAGLLEDEYRYAPGKTLTPQAGQSVNDVRQNVRRCRAKLAEFHREIHGLDPPEDLLIQSKAQRGYRLDPRADVIRKK